MARGSLRRPAAAGWLGFSPATAATASPKPSHAAAVCPTGDLPDLRLSEVHAAGKYFPPGRGIGKAAASVADSRYSPVWSSTSAPGAFFFTDSIPFSADALRS